MNQSNKIKSFRKSLLAGVFSLFLMVPLAGQTYLYFQDSPLSEYFDYSWMELTAPSELERMGAELRRFPVESVIPARQGVNCLRLKWTSKTGGGWFAIAAGDNWAEKNISTADTMVFWLYSVEGITASNLPKIFVEDVTNKKSTFHPLDPWVGDLAASVWTRVTVPMSQFFNALDGTDFTRIKTIGFTQNTSDAVQHTLLIDDMRVFKGTGVAPPADPPTGLIATGYENHIEIAWDLDESANLNGYEIDRSVDGGTSFQTIKVIDNTSRIYIDWVKSFGQNFTASYRVKALNANNDPSVPSEVVSSTTHTMTDEELLDMVQKYTFRYFWDYAEPNSGMARDRNFPVDMVTSGGSGFGVMAILVGIERGYITREQGRDRILKMVNFLETADRFHGAWGHFINGKTGAVIPFSTKDNGGDLVETAFMIQGLLAARQYFDSDDATEKTLVSKITTLWEEVEWDWYRQNDFNVLYWHWSPNYLWQMNMQIRGWNEASIVYMLAIASPTHPVPASLWKNGWAGYPSYRNGRSFYGYKINVGWDYGGPLFFAHYSFLGFDPRNIRDSYTNYFDNNRNIALIHQAYCIQNPLGRTGYSESCWGMTASDDPDGYAVHEPTASRDNGTISPTAALASFPYTPEESMLALKHFYRELGDKTWNWMGFYDAFNQKRNWWATSYLAIDQGPIIVMIENYRTQLLWDLFMKNPEIQPMLDAIGFTASPNPVINPSIAAELNVFPNPADHKSFVSVEIPHSGKLNLEILRTDGTIVAGVLKGQNIESGTYELDLGKYSLVPGVYFLRLNTQGGSPETKMLILH